MAENRDEILERRESELSIIINNLGQTLYDLTHGLKKYWAPNRRKAAEAKLELMEALSQRDEVREVRRLLLGKAPNAHIRTRAVPNFVGDNPNYACVVVNDCSCSPVLEELKQSMHS